MTEGMQPDAQTADFAAGVAVAESAEARAESAEAAGAAEVATAIATDASSSAETAIGVSVAADEKATTALGVSAETAAYVDQRMASQDSKLDAILEALKPPEQEGTPQAPDTKETAKAKGDSGPPPKASLSDRHRKAFWGS